MLCSGLLRNFVTSYVTSVKSFSFGSTADDRHDITFSKKLVLRLH